MKGRGSIVMQCELCRERFRVSPSRYPVARFCSMDCSNEARHRGMVRTTGSVMGRGRAWTDEEDAILREHIRSRGAEYVAERTGRSVVSVKRRAWRTGYRVTRYKLRRWTKEEEEWLRDHLPKMSFKAAAKKLGRTENAVRIRAKQAGAGRRNGDRWSASDVAAVLGVDPKTVVRWIEKGLLIAKKDNGLGSMGTWLVTPAQVRNMIRDHPLMVDLSKVDQLSFIDLLTGGW